MTPTTRRRFTLADAMILIAATGIGIAGTRASVLGIRNHVTMPHKLMDILRFWIFAPVPGMMAWTMAVLIARLLRPVPRWQRLGTQPGTMACGAAAFVATASGLLFFGGAAVQWIARNRPEFMTPFSWTALLTIQAYSIGQAVAGSWLALIVGRRWRPEPDWIDRLGRVLGVGWMTLSTVAWIVFGSL